MSDFIERAKFSCALGGALTTIEGIARAVPIVHAAGGCAAALSGTYNLAAGYRGIGYCGGNMIPTTNIAENNIVFGGEDRLAEQIESTLGALDADLYVVVSGCQVEIIGDDTVAVANRFRDRNVIGASTPGFSGNTYKGYDAVMISIAQNVVAKSDVKEPLTVNILGVVPGHDVFFRGNLDEIKRLLGLIGIKVNTFFGTGDTVESIRTYGSASLSIVLSPVAGKAAAKAFQETHDIPYINAEIPIGPTGTAEFMRKVGDALGVSSEKIDAVIREETEYYYSFLERLVDIYSDLDFQRYAIVAADSYYAHAVTRFLANDLGWVPFLTSIHDISDEYAQADYDALFRDIDSEQKPIVLFEPNSSQILAAVRANWPHNHNEKFYNSLSPAYVVGSVIERGLAEKLGAGFLSVAFPVSNRVILNKGIAGLRGALTFVEDLITNLVSQR
ncbi:oxidoreductase nitrogenase component 1 [Clostridia bacterium]|nr:oxidoreductase nitrogenase component 1 [Clostridia bacterium]